MFLVGAVLFGLVAAFGKHGHEAIAMTAMSGIKGPALANLKRMLGGKDAVDVAFWAHKVEKLYPTSAYHIQPQSEDNCGQETKTVDLSFCDDGMCLVGAMKHFYSRLMGTEYWITRNIYLLIFCIDIHLRF